MEESKLGPDSDNASVGTVPGSVDTICIAQPGNQNTFGELNANAVDIDG